MLGVCGPLATMLLLFLTSLTGSAESGVWTAISFTLLQLLLRPPLSAVTEASVKDSKIIVALHLVAASGLSFALASTLLLLCAVVTGSAA